MLTPQSCASVTRDDQASFDGRILCPIDLPDWVFGGRIFPKTGRRFN